MGTQRKIIITCYAYDMRQIVAFLDINQFYLEWIFILFVEQL